MNQDLKNLHAYPFTKLAVLLQDCKPTTKRTPLTLALGEPKHPTPIFINEALTAHLPQLAIYPTTRGSEELRDSIANWLTYRFHLPKSNTQGGIDPARMILPVNGTREALFAFAQTIIDRTRSPLVLLPNPFYQIYEGAALLAGAEPCYLPCMEETNWLPDFTTIDQATWKRCQLLYLCSPGNPTGAIFKSAELAYLIELAHKYDFVIAADECYSELYLNEDEPTPGLLQVATEMGNDDFSRCIVFHSLSKRSNAPGLRSGFVAGDPNLIENFHTYRTYHGCAMPLPTQFASRAAWLDENHVQKNRQLYREKYNAVLTILSEVAPVTHPAAGFYLWLQTPISDLEFTRQLFTEENLKVLPGRFLSRVSAGLDPGANRIRVALVACLTECIDAAWRIRSCLEKNM